MAIEIACACGKRFSVRDELAGRQARCGGCQAVLQIPERRASTRCFCGHLLEFTAREAGATRPCPACSRPVFLTAAEGARQLEFETQDEIEGPRCMSCGCLVLDPSARDCSECGANLRTGKAAPRRALPRARRVGLRPGGASASPAAPVARLAQPAKESTSAGGSDDPPPPAAMPPHDASHVEWRDSKMAARADELLEHAGERTCEALDYSPGSLAALDYLLKVERGRGAISEARAEQMAAYLGEVVTRNLGGRWASTKDGRPVVAHLPGERTFDALAQVKARVETPAESGSLAQLFIELVKGLGLLSRA